MPDNKTSFSDTGLEYNFATNCKWMAHIPLYKIFTDLEPKDLRFNLSSFSVPEMVLGSTTTTYLTKQVPIPTKILNPDVQEIQFEYIMSENFHQYILLYRWINNIVINLQQNTNMLLASDIGKYSIPIYVILYSAFKTPIIKLTYNGAWIYKVGDLVLDYKNAVDEPIIHNFTVKYTNFSLDVLAPVGGADGLKST